MEIIKKICAILTIIVIPLLILVSLYLSVQESAPWWRYCLIGVMFLIDFKLAKDISNTNKKEKK